MSYSNAYAIAATCIQATMVIVPQFQPKSPLQSLSGQRNLLPEPLRDLSIIYSRSIYARRGYSTYAS